MELRSRSRSTTPFFTQQIEENNGREKRVTRSTTVKTTISNDTRAVKTRRSKILLHKTSDYSSEDGENDVIFQQHITDNEKNQIIEDAIAASNGNEEISALNLYRKSGRYWDLYPKTDWTYSPSSKDRVEIAPGVVAMPNMSRRTIHSQGDCTDYYTTNEEVYNGRYTNLTPRNTQLDDYKLHSVKKRWLITTMFITIYTSIITSVYWIYSTENSLFVRLAKKIHHFVSWIMLIDTWTLQKSPKGNNRKLRNVLLLCLLPLLLFGGWWLVTSIGDYITLPFANRTKTTIPSNPPPPINPQPMGSMDSNRIHQLQDELDRMREMMSKMEMRTVEMEETIKHTQSRTVAMLMQELRKCCRRTPSIITSSKNHIINTNDFITHKDLEELIANYTKLIDNSRTSEVEMTEDGVVDGAQIRQIVKDMLRVYDADRTGLVDYAMEPMGGEVVTTRCTETYHAGGAVLSILGIPLYYRTNSPRTVITAGVLPGECWAFQNFPGFLVIKLAQRIRVESISIEHINRALVPDGRVDSAPKDFTIHGLVDENDINGRLLGEFTYKIGLADESLQYFQLTNPAIYDMVEVRIRSNHGNPNYTCLYRVRVHGSTVAIDNEKNR